MNQVPRSLSRAAVRRVDRVAVERWGVPGVGVKDSTTGKYLENLQTEPDVRVMNDYAVVGTGKDQQLEAAVAGLMRLVK